MRIADALLDSDGRIADVTWAAARSANDPVGECHPECGALVYAEPTDRAFGRRFFVASCTNGHEAVIPATRVVRAPTASVLMPSKAVSAAMMAAARERDLAILGERE